MEEPELLQLLGRRVGLEPAAAGRSGFEGRHGHHDTGHVVAGGRVGR
jgi:hypothetical protein